MNLNINKETFLSLVRYGIGKASDIRTLKETDWRLIQIIAEQQGLSAIVLDGIDRITSHSAKSMIEIPLELKMEWIGDVLQNYEQRYVAYENAIASLAGFYNTHGFKMMVLKGYACSLDWPKPEHRPCGDIDVWLFGQQKDADKALAGNKNLRIDGGQHHHTVFDWQGFAVENHYDFINVYHHPSHRGIETILKNLGKDDTHYVEIGGEKVYVPSPNLHALFLFRHALNHFASIGINLRNVLDWAFFVEKHTKEIDWNWLLEMIDEYYMREFFGCINAICVDDLGFSDSIFPSVQYLPKIKKRVLNDILNPEFTIEEPDGYCRKWIHKYRRWKGNRWKQKLCFKESAWSVFWSSMKVHLVKPKAS